MICQSSTRSVGAVSLSHNDFQLATDITVVFISSNCASFSKVVFVYLRVLPNTLSQQFCFPPNLFYIYDLMANLHEFVHSHSLLMPHWQLGFGVELWVHNALLMRKKYKKHSIDWRFNSSHNETEIGANFFFFFFHA